jgi:hypothetical protein
MTFKRALAIALTAAAALPASAGAQAQIQPTQGDNYLSPLALSDFSNPGKFPREEIGWVANTTDYTVQADMFNPPGSGGPAEPNNCGSEYGKTIWSVLHLDHRGTLTITTSAQFDSVIGFVPFESPNSPAPEIDKGVCIDRLSGLDEQLAVKDLSPGWYAVQVGGTGTTQGGQVQTKFLFKPTNPPPRVKGKIKTQATLNWHGPPYLVTTMYASDVPKGQTLTLSCTRHACNKRKIRVRSKPAGRSGVFSEPPAMSDWAGMSGSDVRAKPVSRSSAYPRASASRPIVQAARKRVQLLKNRQVPRGTKIILRITAPRYIGKYLEWSIPGSLKTRCMNPGSTKPRRKCK